MTLITSMFGNPSAALLFCELLLLWAATHYIGDEHRVPELLPTGASTKIVLLENLSWVGVLTMKTERFCRTDMRLRKNEVVHLNEAVYKIKPKLLLRQTADSLVAAIDYRGIWFGRSVIAILLNSDQYRLEYLLGLMNSAYLNHLYHELVHEKGRVFAQVKLSKLNQLPIRTIDFADSADSSQHERMVQLVQQMTYILERSASARTAQERVALRRQADATQRQIDQLVYELYGLTDAEITSIEGLIWRDSVKESCTEELTIPCRDMT